MLDLAFVKFIELLTYDEFFCNQDVKKFAKMVNNNQQ